MADRLFVFQYRRHRSGAARMNLIVGMFILILIAAAMVPTVTATRKRAAEVECLSNLGLMAQANKRLPPQSQDNMIWLQRFLEEAGLHENVYRCPSTWETGEWGSSTQAWKHETMIAEGRLWLIGSYTLNAWTVPPIFNAPPEVIINGVKSARL